MKIAYLAPANVIHTVKWVDAFANKGHDVHLITMHPDSINANVTIHELPIQNGLGYYLNTPRLKRLLKSLRPDLFHVHYASGYGTLGRLAGYQPTILSVWGSDVYDFPYESKMKARILTKNLKSAKWICSTSEAMAQHTKQFCPDISDLAITPFGVDTNQFKLTEGLRDNNLITIGTVKTLADKYGIDVLIQGFSHLMKNVGQDTAGRLRLMIVGGGPQKEELKHLAKSLGIAHAVEFVGQIAHEKVPEYLNRFDIYVAASRSESFGVAVIEASACGLPVIVSDVGGLPEVVKHGITGFVVPSEDIESLSATLQKLVVDTELRKQLGASGKQWVLEKYNWTDCVRIMEDVYKTVVS